MVIHIFSKFAHFFAIKHPFIAIPVTQIIFDEVLKLYDLPKSIVSESNRIFVSELWSEQFKLQGTSLHHGSVNHPQSLGFVALSLMNGCDGCIRLHIDKIPYGNLQLGLPLTKSSMIDTLHFCSEIFLNQIRFKR